MVILQRPNIPLAVWAIAWLVSWLTSGEVHTVFATISVVALAVWAVWELTRGVSWVRRLMGAIVLLYLLNAHVLHLWR